MNWIYIYKNKTEMKRIYYDIQKKSNLQKTNLCDEYLFSMY